MSPDHVLDVDRLIVHDILPRTIDDDIMVPYGRPASVTGPDCTPRTLLSVSVGGLEVIGEVFKDSLPDEREVPCGYPFSIPPGACKAFFEKWIIGEGEDRIDHLV